MPTATRQPAVHDCNTLVHLLKQELVLEQLMQAGGSSPVRLHLFISKVHQILLQVGFVHQQAPLMSNRNLQDMQL